MKKLKILSLFSGAGGLDLGFRNAGFDITTSNEIDTDTFETYKYNFPNTKHIGGSIIKLQKEELEDYYDGIIGGPPCQSWSEAGRQKGIDDPRGKLFYEYVRILELIKPKFFLAENVSGILHKKHQGALKNITDRFSDVGYNVDYKLLDAVDYNVPQNRKRVFIIGIRNDVEKNFIFPSIGLFKPNKTLEDALSDLPNPKPALEKNKSNFQNHATDSNQVSNNEFMIGSFSTIFMSRNRVRGWDEPSFTIQAGGRHAPLHPNAPKMKKVEKDLFQFCKKNIDKYRRLSVRECARIQTFPDDFVFFYEQVADAYKMIGNAVPVKLAEALGVEIKSQLFAP
ncbi:MAG: DNA cytosine methyltransferase [Candidatus Puniceispirillales bacterium]